MIKIPSVHYFAILPVMIYFGASLALLVISALRRSRLSATAATTFSVLSSVAVIVVGVFEWLSVSRHGASETVAHAIVLDRFGVLATVAVALGTLLTSLVAQDWALRSRLLGVENQILILATSAGAIMMAMANDLIVIFLGLEILSIGLYVLVAMDRHRARSAEAALKYFLLGGLAAAIFIYGVAILYGATGTTTISTMSLYFATNYLLHPGLAYLGGALVLIAFAFKVAAVPFHNWAPDVYEGAPTPITGYMAAVVKVGAFLGFIRVILSGLGTNLDTWRPILFALIVLSTVVGAVLGLAQKNVKRLLAYSSINQAGFMMLGLWAGTGRGIASTLFFVCTYVPVIIATFAIVGLVGGAGDDAHDIEAYRGLGRRQPWLGAALALLLLSQLGAPFTLGFFAKFSVVASALDASGTTLSVVTMLSAAIAAVFYLRWTQILFANDPASEARVTIPVATGFVIALGAVAVVVFGVWPTPIMWLCQHASIAFLP
jgi:NADH-quinone oxidoreductase subunit N